MMTVRFMPCDVTTYLQCRRGRSVFRKVRIDPGVYEADYNALPQSALELVDATGHVWSRADVKESRGGISLEHQGAPKATFDPTAYNRQKKKEAAVKEARAAREADKARQIEAKKIISEKSKAQVDPVKIGEKNEGTTTSEPDQRPKAKDDDDLQQVGGERSNDGEALRRPVHLQVPLVGKSDARLERPKERRPESSADGLHSNDDEPDVLDD